MTFIPFFLCHFFFYCWYYYRWPPYSTLCPSPPSSFPLPSGTSHYCWCPSAMHICSWLISSPFLFSPHTPLSCRISQSVLYIHATGSILFISRSTLNYLMLFIGENNCELTLPVGNGVSVNILKWHWSCLMRSYMLNWSKTLFCVLASSLASHFLIFHRAPRGIF